MYSMRIGQGFDIHAFCSGNEVALGGIKIPYHYGVKAHSDGDVVLHALCDALLGAAGLDDIGVHFPDTDERWRDVDSKDLLHHVAHLLMEQHWSIANVDITLLAESPKIKHHRDLMRQTIAEILGILPQQVNLKATTNEGLGSLGRQEGLAALAVALIYSNVSIAK